MKKLLILTTLSLITMHGFTAHENTDGQSYRPYKKKPGEYYPYKMKRNEFDKLITQIANNCHSECRFHLNCILETLKCNGVLVIENGPNVQETLVDNKSKLKKITKLPKNDFMAASITGCDRFVDGPYEMISPEDFRQCNAVGKSILPCNALKIASLKKWKYIKKHKKLKSKINGWLYPYLTSNDEKKKDTKRLRELEEEMKYREEFLKNLKAKTENRLWHE